MTESEARTLSPGDTVEVRHVGVPSIREVAEAGAVNVREEWLLGAVVSTSPLRVHVMENGGPMEFGAGHLGSIRRRGSLP